MLWIKTRRVHHPVVAAGIGKNWTWSSAILVCKHFLLQSIILLMIFHSGLQVMSLADSPALLVHNVVRYPPHCTIDASNVLFGNVDSHYFFFTQTVSIDWLGTVKRRMRAGQLSNFVIKNGFSEEELTLRYHAYTMWFLEIWPPKATQTIQEKWWTQPDSSWQHTRYVNYVYFLSYFCCGYWSTSFQFCDRVQIGACYACPCRPWASLEVSSMGLELVQRRNRTRKVTPKTLQMWKDEVVIELNECWPPAQDCWSPHTITNK